MIYERRKKDAAIKKRKIDMQCIREELRETTQWFTRHIEALRDIAPVQTIIIENLNLEDAKHLVREIFQKEICASKN